jgi:hypothetical protein
VLFSPPNHVRDSVDDIWDHVVKGAGRKSVDSFFEKIFLGS